MKIEVKIVDVNTSLSAFGYSYTTANGVRVLHPNLYSGIEAAKTGALGLTVGCKEVTFFQISL